MTNRAFWRAVHGLAHPVTMGAVFLLLLNDHLLRVYWPSWWTGKVGDAAWLLFAPFILAVLLALVIPARFMWQEKAVGGLACVLIGAWFGLAKTVPEVHGLTVGVLDSIVGWHGTLGLDPEDLITLPSLLISGLIWQRSANTAPTLSPRVWVVLALAMMSTLATSCIEPETGVEKLCEKDGVLYALPTEAIGAIPYTTPDGGRTWVRNDYDNELVNFCYQRHLQLPRDTEVKTWLLQDGDQTFRFVPGEGIYSYDGDNVERLEIDLAFMDSDVREIHYERPSKRGLCSTRVFKPGPLDALVDSQTGNLIVAMGLDGILLRTAEDGQWQWVTVGEYSFTSLEQLDRWAVIMPYLINVVLLLFLMPPSVSWLLGRLPGRVKISLILGWLAWLSLRFFFGVFAFRDPFSIYVIGICFTIGLLLNNWLYDHYVSSFNSLAPVGVVWILSLLTAGLILLPYVLWVQGTVPNLDTAHVFALMMGVSGFVTTVHTMSIRFPHKRKKKEAE